MKELIDMLTKKLGVNATQAEGGAAVLFKAAKDKLGGEEFGKLLGGVPGLGDLMNEGARQRWRWPRRVVRRPGGRHRRQRCADQHHRRRLR